jgi:hypothetical protein
MAPTRPSDGHVGPFDARTTSPERSIANLPLLRNDSRFPAARDHPVATFCTTPVDVRRPEQAPGTRNMVPSALAVRPDPVCTQTSAIAQNVHISAGACRTWAAERGVAPVGGRDHRTAVPWSLRHRQEELMNAVAPAPGHRSEVTASERSRCSCPDSPAFNERCRSSTASIRRPSTAPAQLAPCEGPHSRGS